MCEAPEWQHLKAYGYAPGDYMNKCHACGKVVEFVDKLATTCRPCAEAWHAEAHPQAPASPQPEAEARKAVADLYQHSETGRTRIVMRDALSDCDAQWLHVGALVLATPSAGAPLPEQQEAQVEALTDERIDRIADLTVKGMPDGIRGFMKEWGWRQFARNLAEILATPPASSRVAAPTPQAVKVPPLTQEQANEVWRAWVRADNAPCDWLSLLRLTEAAHGIQPSEGERSHD
jgi:hypothetical protein